MVAGNPLEVKSIVVSLKLRVIESEDTYVEVITE